MSGPASDPVTEPGAPLVAEQGVSSDAGPGAHGTDRLEGERRLLVEALTAYFAPTDRAEGEGSEQGRGAPEGEPTRESADEPGDDSAGPTDRAASEDGAASEEPQTGRTGCAECGCAAPQACSVCPLCRGLAAVLDPALLERAAGLATVIAQALTAAAARSRAAAQHPEASQSSSRADAAPDAQAASSGLEPAGADTATHPAPAGNVDDPTERTPG